MKKVGLLFILITLLISGCDQQKNDINHSDEDIIQLKEEINNLTKENNKLKVTLEELSLTVKSNNKYIKELKETKEDTEEKLKIQHEHIDGCYDRINSLDSYIKNLSEYKEVLGYITKYDDSNSVLFVDEYEFITMQETTRIEELGLDLDRNFPSGFYIYDASEREEMYILNDRTHFYILDSSLGYKNYVSREEFMKQMKEYKRPCSILIIDNKVVEVSEVYIP